MVERRLWRSAAAPSRGGSGRLGTTRAKGRASGRPATALGARASRPQGRRCHRPDRPGARMRTAPLSIPPHTAIYHPQARGGGQGQLAGHPYRSEAQESAGPARLDRRRLGLLRPPRVLRDLVEISRKRSRARSWGWGGCAVRRRRQAFQLSTCAGDRP